MPSTKPTTATKPAIDTQHQGEPTGAPAKAPRRRKTRKLEAPPWIQDGIDYGPAVLAIEDLMAWAFDLAERSAGDWPAARRKVKRARRAMLAMLHGRPMRPADEDVLFTASLLIRVLDADLGLGFSDIVSVLAELGLPTADVPYPPPPRPRGTAVRVPQAPPVAAPAALALLLGGRPPAPLAPVVPITRARPRAVAVPAPCAACPARPGLAFAA